MTAWSGPKAPVRAGCAQGLEAPSLRAARPPSGGQPPPSWPAAARDADAEALQAALAESRRTAPPQLAVGGLSEDDALKAALAESRHMAPPQLSEEDAIQTAIADSCREDRDRRKGSGATQENAIDLEDSGATLEDAIDLDSD